MRDKPVETVVFVAVTRFLVLMSIAMLVFGAGYWAGSHQ